MEGLAGLNGRGCAAHLRLVYRVEHELRFLPAESRIDERCFIGSLVLRRSDCKTSTTVEGRLPGRAVPHDLTDSTH